jgi:hypothetical protein
VALLYRYEVVFLANNPSVGCRFGPSFDFFDLENLLDDVTGLTSPSQLVDTYIHTGSTVHT